MRTEKERKSARMHIRHLIERDIALLPVQMRIDVDALELQHNLELNIDVSLPDGRIIPVKARWLRRRYASYAMKDCPDCNAKLGMLYDYYYGYWKCSQCDFRMPVKQGDAL